MSIEHLDVCHKLEKERVQSWVTPILSLGHPFPLRDPFNKQTNKVLCSKHRVGNNGSEEQWELPLSISLLRNKHFNEGIL